MGLITQQFRIFVYDPGLDDGAFRPTSFDLWATSEKEALLELQRSVTQPLTLWEKGGLAAMHGKGLQFIARAHSDKSRWPNVQTGRLPNSTNENYMRDAERGRV